MTIDSFSLEWEDHQFETQSTKSTIFKKIFAISNKFFVYIDAKLQQQFCMHIESSFPIYDKLYLIMINLNH